MAGAVLLGVGVSFVGFRLAGAHDGPGGWSTPRAGAQTVSESLGPDQIRSAIAPYLERTREECWKIARELREPDAPDEASLEVAIQIDATGRVLDAKSRATAKGYPGLGDCVATRVRGWTFPSAANPSTIHLAFVFKKD